MSTVGYARSHSPSTHNPKQTFLAQISAQTSVVEKVSLAFRINQDFLILADQFTKSEVKQIRTSIEILSDAQRYLDKDKLEYKHFSSHKRNDKKLTEFLAGVCLAAEITYERDKENGALFNFFKVLSAPGCHLKKGNAIIEYCYS